MRVQQFFLEDDKSDTFLSEKWKYKEKRLSLQYLNS